MRLWILSDLHVDVCAWTPPDPAPAHDVVVIAGDVRDRLSKKVIPWVHQHFGAGAPVVYVPGNHDFWRTNHTKEKAKARDAATRAGIHLLLDGDTAIIGGVRFIGGTLWTDYALRPEESAAAQAASARTMNDHKLVRQGAQYHKWWTTNQVVEHRQTRARIEAALAVSHDGPTVVVTHHPPHEQSLANGGWQEPLDGAYASDLTAVMEGPHAPDVWIHGHVHVRQDYRVGNTRVVANPRGYIEHYRRARQTHTKIENPDFSDAYTLTI